MLKLTECHKKLFPFLKKWCQKKTEEMNQFILILYFMCLLGRSMRTFDESAKSKKTVSSMIENKKVEKKPARGKENKPVKSMYSTVMYCTMLEAVERHSIIRGNVTALCTANTRHLFQALSLNTAKPHY